MRTIWYFDIDPTPTRTKRLNLIMKKSDINFTCNHCGKKIMDHHKISRTYQPCSAMLDKYPTL